MWLGIGNGTTRTVVLAGRFAIKFGRPKPLAALWKLVAYPFMGEVARERFREKHAPTYLRGIWNCLIAGLLANRNEADYWFLFGDNRVAPVAGVFFRGWVLVQWRGKTISKEEFVEAGLFWYLSPSERSSFGLDRPWQFKRFGEYILLVDYGRRSVVDVLTRTRSSARSSARTPSRAAVA